MGIRVTLTTLTDEQASSVADADVDDEGMLELIDALVDEADGTASSLELDKSWHGLHYLLTGTAWEGEPPACFLVRGGSVILPDDGEGATRLLSTTEVREFATFLASLPAGEIKARFVWETMMELQIYPTIWDRPAAEDDTRGWLLGYYAQLEHFVTGAAERGLSLLISP